MTGVVEPRRAALERRLERIWYGGALTPGDRLLALLLAPATLLVRLAAARARARIERLPAPPVPVVVVGNLVVGGAGKTPATIAIASALAARGWRVGVLSSGYRAPRQEARLVDAGSDATRDGDEPVLLARATGLPVAAGRRRGDALRALLAAHPGLDVVVSDDGLQHAGLARTLEVAVFGARGAGNGRLLPAGPLREPLARLRRFDAILLNDAARVPLAPPLPPTFRFDVEANGLRHLLDGRRMTCEEFARFAHARPVTAVAGIAHPGRFFATLGAAGVDAMRRPLADHAPIDAALLDELDADLVVMTEKDAVKCDAVADARCWALEVRARLDPAFFDWLEERLRGHPIARDPGLPVVQGAA